MKLTLEALREAQNLVARHISPTPQLRWPLLGEALDGEVWLKHENHTPTGAFKVRGGITYIDGLMRRSKPPEQLITATRGNHGQSIPYAARPHGLPVQVLVPEGNSQEKNAAMRGWGAQVEVFGHDFDEARCEAERRASAGMGELVPSFHPDLVSGVASYALELFDAAGELDAIYVPVGMGSGICAVIAARDALGMNTEVVGVVAQAADAVARSFERGEIVETPSAATFADGMACRVPHPQALDVVRRGADRIVRVSEQSIADAMRLIYRTSHNVAEGAGAAACAAIATEGGARGKRVGAILTGGNVDTPVLQAVLAGETPGIVPSS